MATLSILIPACNEAAAIGAVIERVAAYERSLSINAGQIRPRVMVIRILREHDPRRAAEELEQLRYVESFYRRAE